MKWIAEQWHYVTSQTIDKTVLLSSVLLTAVGIIMITSASMDVAAADEYTNFDAYFYMKRQLVYVLLGVITAFFWLLMPSDLTQRWPFVILLGSLAILLLVWAFGTEVNGSQRWIRIGFFNVQPSEFAKIGLVMYIASYLYRRRDELRRSVFGFIKPLFIMGLVCYLLLLEPDFGTTFVIVVTVGAMCFLAGARIRHLTGLAAILLPVLYLFVNSIGYRSARIQAFIDPWADAFGLGYQTTQAQIAFGRGGWLGEGHGNSTQKLSFLPEAHTDFVYTVLAEEWGGIGAIVIVLIYGVLILRALKIGEVAERLGRYYSAYLCYGLCMIITCQTIINVGVNLSLLPVKGLTLPFVSYGGSSMIACAISLGIMLRISMENQSMLTQRRRESIDTQQADVKEQSTAQADYINREVVDEPVSLR